MKKVLFMLSSMNIGGVEKSLLSLLSVMPVEKYDITVLLLEKKGGFIKHIPQFVKVEEVSWYGTVKPIIMQPPQQTIMNYMNRREFVRIPSFLNSYILSEKILKDRYIYYKNIFKRIPLHSKEYDIAISFQGPTDIIDFYIAEKVTARKKISWVHFDISQHTINEKLYNRLYRKFDKIFVVSNEARKRLIDKIPNIKAKSEVIKNIISKKVINNMARMPVEFDGNSKGMRIITVGRLSKEKGQDMAIKALSRLRKDGYEVRWYCIGEGKQRKEYERLIETHGLKDHFILMGSIPNPYPFIAEADLYVQPSRHEGYCLTLAEAKCLDKPIVTTDFIGAKEQINDGYNGWIVKTNEDDLYEKIKFLIDNPNQTNELKIKLSESDLDTTTEVDKLLKYIS
ncbi:glycosyltransferase [Virgibacillus sp. L01]|uniref:glycosyltransferase n=1 Tax=Virgibacillus sp. L01 TaxID=3457429 RepID=UPI003FCF9A4E